MIHAIILIDALERRDLVDGNFRPATHQYCIEVSDMRCCMAMLSSSHWIKMQSRSFMIHARWRSRDTASGLTGLLSFVFGVKIIIICMCVRVACVSGSFSL